MINVTIDNKAIQVPEGTTILKAARMAGIDIPTLCYFELDGMKFENKPGGCRVCMVEVTKDFNGKPRRNLAPACATDCVLLNYGAGKDSQESLGQQRDQTSPS